MTEATPRSPVWARLLRRVERWSGHGVDAEDLLQSAYESLCRTRRNAEVRNPVAFLYRAAVNAGIDRVRKDRWVEDDFEVHHDGLGITDGQPMLDETLRSRERLERVREGIALLSPRTRQVFVMHRLEGLKYREVASRLGISQSAVEKHIAKATMFLTDWSEGW